MKKQITKSIAMALAAITISLPFSSQALAAPHHEAHPAPHHKMEQRHIPKHEAHPVVHRDPEHKQPYHAPAPAPCEKKHHSGTGNFVTGAIVGGILGAILAKNT